MESDFICLIKTAGLIPVTSSLVHCKCGHISETVHNSC